MKVWSGTEERFDGLELKARVEVVSRCHVVIVSGRASVLFPKPSTALRDELVVWNERLQ